MKTILGTGQLGIAVLEALLKVNPDESIMLVNRSGKVEKTIPANVSLVAADVTDKKVMEEIAKKSDVIFSCTDVSYQTWDKFYPAATSALAHALDHSDAKVVFADNLYSYGNVLGATMHEDFPHLAQTRKGKIRASVINTLLHSGNKRSKRVAFVKAADFIGPTIYKGVFGTDFLDKLFKRKTIFLSGNIHLSHTFTYIYDFANAMITVAGADDAFGQIWHTPNAQAMSLDKWIHLFEVNTNRKAKVVVLPKFLVGIAGVFNSFIKEFYELAYQFEYPYLVDHAKYENRFGSQLTYPSSIVKETVQWYKTKNNLYEN